MSNNRTRSTREFLNEFSRFLEGLLRRDRRTPRSPYEVWHVRLWDLDQATYQYWQVCVRDGVRYMQRRDWEYELVEYANVGDAAEIRWPAALCHYRLAVREMLQRVGLEAGGLELVRADNERVWRPKPPRRRTFVVSRKRR